MKFCAVTDKGMVRSRNEDCLFASDRPTGELPNLFMVADGMGGHKAGEEASALAVNTSLDYLRKVSMKSKDNIMEDMGQTFTSAMEMANREILRQSRAFPEKAGMGTTLICTTISRDKVYMASIGDSRIYILGSAGFYQVTRDHTVVGEMIRMGSISKEVAKRHPNRHMLTRALGAVENIDVDVFSTPVSEVSQILMCTDGLYNMLTDQEMESVLTMSGEVDVRTKRLVEIANEKGGNDNVTAILIDLKR